MILYTAFLLTAAFFIFFYYFALFLAEFSLLLKEQLPLTG